MTEDERDKAIDSWVERTFGQNDPMGFTAHICGLLLVAIILIVVVVRW